MHDAFAGFGLRDERETGDATQFEHRALAHHGQVLAYPEEISVFEIPGRQQTVVMEEASIPGPDTPHLLNLNKNPLDDIRAVSKVEAVFVNGFFLSRTNLDALLAYQERVASLQPPQSLPGLALGVTQDEGVVVTGSLDRADKRTGNRAPHLQTPPFRRWQVAH